MVRTYNVSKGKGEFERALLEPRNGGNDAYNLSENYEKISNEKSIYEC